MSAKHTPGPWRFAWGGGHALVFDAKGGPTIAGVPFNCDDDIPLVEANARLIAAAPELLEALQSCEKALQALCHPVCKDDPDSPLNLASAAIAKATGGQQ